MNAHSRLNLKSSLKKTQSAKQVVFNSANSNTRKDAAKKPNPEFESERYSYTRFTQTVPYYANPNAKNQKPGLRDWLKYCYYDSYLDEMVRSGEFIQGLGFLGLILLILGISCLITCQYMQTFAIVMIIIGAIFTSLLLLTLGLTISGEVKSRDHI